MKKNTKIYIGIGTAVCIILIALAIYFSMPSLKQTSYTMEYGKSINLNTKELFNSSFIEPTNIQLDTSKIKNEADKNYPAVGTYKIMLTYHDLIDHSKTLTIKVKDTTKPKITTSSDSIDVALNDNNHDFSKYFTIEDLSECYISFDTQKVDFTTPGTYVGKIKVTDKYNNSTSKEFNIVIQNEENQNDTSSNQNNSTTQSQNNPSTPQTTIEPYYVNGILVVNKKHPLPANYGSQEDSTALSQLQKMIADMQSLGLSISNSYSGYRSYQYQSNLYQNYVNSYGQASADTFSARPGYSEHQTGLAFDLIQPNGALLESPNEAQWVAQNAHKYGFIVRYQSGKESITGYMAEPWHVRYIGSEATNIYQSGLTLEEYLHVEGGDY